MRPNHLTEAQLLLLVDGELPEAERRACERHLADCLRCRRALQSLNGILAGITSELSTIPVATDGMGTAALPGRGARPPARAARAVPTGALRAAAIAGIALVSLAAVEPVRAWVWERFAGMAADLPAEEIRPYRADLTPTSGRLRFVPASETLRVHVAGVQERGTLTLLPGEDDTKGLLEFSGASGHEGVLVSEGRIAIENTPLSEASYRLHLPTGIRRVELIVGSRLLRVIEPPGAGGEVTFDLEG